MEHILSGIYNWTFRMETNKLPFQSFRLFRIISIGKNQNSLFHSLSKWNFRKFASGRTKTACSTYFPIEFSGILLRYNYYGVFHLRPKWNFRKFGVHGKQPQFAGACSGQETGSRL